MQSVALLGLGVMGAGMGHNLLKAGFPLSVYNRTQSKADPLVVNGARLASTPADAVRDAQIVISMVGDDRASRGVWAGEEGALAAARPDTILVESSTLTIEWISELAALAAARSLPFLDAPVTGSKEAAEAGELRLLIGGDPNVLERARPALEAISKQIDHFGPNGAGAAIKLINNLMAGVQAAVLGEGLALAERAGLDMEQVVAFITSAAPGSPLVKSKAARMADSNYGDTQFALKWMHKDTTYALRAADQFGVPMPTVAAAREVYRIARNLGLDDADFAAVIEAVRRQA